MGNKEIRNELKESENYKLETYEEKIYDLLSYNPKKIEKYKDSEKRLIKLSFENIAKIEAMLKYNSSYTNFYDDMLLKNNEIDLKKIEDNIKTQKYKYSSTYYIKYIKRYKNDSDIIKNKKFYNKLIEAVVKTIDKENSTHLNSDGVGIKQIAQRICEYEFEDLYKLLKSNECKLIGELSFPTNPDNEKFHARTNFSFATKFCHYMCFNLFDNDNQDKFSIYDRVLAENLPLYFYHFKNYYKQKTKPNYNNSLKNYFDKTEPYEIVRYDLGEVKKYGKYNKDTKRYKKADSDEIKQYFIKKYFSYIELVDNIRKAAKEENKSEIELSRNGLDHLIWYSNK